MIKILQQAAARIYKSLRKKDTVARLDGDEFAMLLPVTNLIAAQKIVKKFESLFVFQGQKLDVGISIGVVEFPTHGDDVNILMQRADHAMYYAKKNKLGSALYKLSDDNNSIEHFDLVKDLSKAIEQRLLSTYYQPMVDMLSHKVFAAEATLMWQHSSRGDIPADEFIPLAEQSGLITQLTDYVISEALKNCALWQQRGFAVKIAINISAFCLKSNNFPQLLGHALDSYKLDAKNCVLEISENAFMKDAYQVKEILHEIDAMGINISIDDFGSGYSSIAYLNQIPLSIIKINNAIIQQINEDDHDDVLIKILIDIARHLEITVIADGVDSVNVYSKLHALGVDRIQGHVISAVLNKDDFLDFLTQYYSSGFIIKTQNISV